MDDAQPRLHPELVLTVIATSKSTVLGLRLDHDRRAWVEAAAAQAGLTVRGFFEGLIDRARIETSGEGLEAHPDISGAGLPDGGDTTTVTGVPGDEATAGPRGIGETSTPSDEAERGDLGITFRTADHNGRPTPRPMPEVPRLLLLPGQVIGAASSATAVLIESGGRCIRDTWRVFLVTLLQGDEDDESFASRAVRPGRRVPTNRS